jgi:hypothetical protein
MTVTSGAVTSTRRDGGVAGRPAAGRPLCNGDGGGRPGVLRSDGVLGSRHEHRLYLQRRTYIGDPCGIHEGCIPELAEISQLPVAKHVRPERLSYVLEEMEHWYGLCRGRAGVAGRGG